jgi:hypothetical protein
VFLLSDKASFVTGMAMPVDGGRWHSNRGGPALDPDECRLLRVERKSRVNPSTSQFDAVDGSSTGTSVPWMWALLRLPTIQRSELC